MAHENIPQDADRDTTAGEVPAGGKGADSGAADAVGVDPDDTAEVQNVSSQNDTAGVGTRPPDPATEADGAVVEQPQRAADPGFVRDDEAPGAAHHNARVSERDSDDAQRARADVAYQHVPRMAQNAPTHEEELTGIVAQTRGDVTLGIAETRIPGILRQRLTDAGIGHDDALIDDLVRRVRAS